MQVNVTQDVTVKQYTQAAQDLEKVTSAATEKTDGKENASNVQKPDTDRAEFNKDKVVTTKMSDSERASLVKSLKEDLNNQMSRFTNMMMQTFQKQGITYALAGDDADKMKEMQAAVEKGFQQAGAAWGGDLPSICGDTRSAVGKLFEDYYAKQGDK